MAWVEVEPGVRLRVRRMSGGKAPFLLVHGLSSNARLWDEVAAHLHAAGHPTCAVDLRNHGESSPADTGHDTATAAADLAIVIRELGLGRPIVVGQSWGGNVVVRLAARHPELVSGLGLVDGGWGDLRAAYGTWEVCSRKLRPSDLDGVSAKALREWITGTHPDWSQTAIDATMANFRVRPDGTLERRLPIDRHMRIVRSMWDEPPAADHPHVKAPVLLLPATSGDQQRAERAERAAKTMRGAIVWYRGADHDLHAQHPARVAADLLRLAV